MKIVLIHNKYQQPGGEDVVFEQERKLLQDAGHQVVAYVRNNSEIREGSVVERLKLACNTISSADSREEILQLLQREKPDIAHIHNTFMMISPAVYGACREADVPVVQTLHNYRLMCPAANFYRDGRVCEECFEHGLMRSVQHGCYRDSRAATATVAAMLLVHRRRNTWEKGIDRFIALSEFSRSKFVSGGLPSDRISVKPNFVDPDPKERTEQGQYAVFVGRMSSEKGLDTLVEGWSRLKTRIPLMMVGDGPMSAGLEAKARERGLANIVFRGRLPRPEAQAAVKGSSFMMLSSECYENFPMGMAEAFACGVPVVCSRLGALGELVENERTGLHFNPGDPDDLAAKVEWAWQHPDRMQQMGKEARQEYLHRYTAEKNLPMLMNIYQSALERRQ